MSFRAQQTDPLFSVCVAETAETSDPPGFCQRPAYIFCPQLGFWLVTAIYSVLKHFTVNSSQANVGITRLWPSIKRSHLWWIWIQVSNLHIKKVALIRYVFTPSVKLQLHLKLCGEISQNAVIFIEIYVFESSAWRLPCKFTTLTKSESDFCMNSMLQHYWQMFASKLSPKFSKCTCGALLLNI